MLFYEPKPTLKQYICIDKNLTNWFPNFNSALMYTISCSFLERKLFPQFAADAKILFNILIKNQP